jgi:hypothetical protein
MYECVCVCCYNSYHGNAVKGFGPYGIIFMTVNVYYLDFPVIRDGKYKTC